jgi:hypothetical protein
MKNQTTSYVIDKKNCIISTKGYWDEFADENGCQKYSLKYIFGRNIWDFIKGDVTRMWVEAVFQYARLLNIIVERPYRCDSPDLKRFMRMRIVPEKGGILCIEHEILSTEQIYKPVDIQYGVITMNDAKQRCSICGRVKVGAWQEPHGDHAGTSGQIVVIYTVCEDCQELIPRTYEV